MTSILKVDTIQDQSGNNIINENADTITIGASGDTVDVPGTEVKTNKVSPTSGTTLTLGDSGDTITIPSGATLTNNGTQTGLTLSDNILFNTASKGIYLGVTTATASNLLNDYEEGTWTGELRGATTAATTAVTATGNYVKIGRLVFVKIYFANVNTTGASGNAQITGLPFAADNLQILPVMTYGQDYDDTTGIMSIQMYLENNTTAQLLVTKDNAAWQATGITAGTGKFFALTGSYYTTA